MNSILVVCIGNICRSPMGEALLAHALPHMHVSSAGIGALVGNPADPIAAELMAQRGLDVSQHRARQITLSMCRQADLILAMDDEQRRHIESRYPLAHGKIFRLGDAAKINIPDPYRRGQLAFDQALEMIDDGAQKWAERIRRIQQ